MTQAPAFDAAVYDLPIPKADGLKADRLAISVGGTLPLERTSKTDLDLVNGFKIGERYTLEIEVVCTGKPAIYTPGTDDKPGTLAHTTNLKLVSIR